MDSHVSNVQAVTWLWHDAVVKSVLLEIVDGNMGNIVIATELYDDEDLSVLSDMNVFGTNILLKFSDVERFICDWFPSPAKNETIRSWDMVPNGRTAKHHIKMNSGGTLEILSNSVVLDSQ